MIKEEKAKEYVSQFDQFQRINNRLLGKGSYEHSLEACFESLRDWSIFHELEMVRQWFIALRTSYPMIVESIPLNETKGWVIDSRTGNITHQSGDFFSIHGIRAHLDQREVGKGGWDQPILEQVGLDGGLLGIIRKRFLGVPHYLCEAKAEPGNYGKVQISPTLQATFANLRQAHGGKKPWFAEYFENRGDNGVKVLFDSWLAEDGGRLHLKRNRGILIEVEEDVQLPNERFIWLSLFQIKALLRENAWINPHVRGILAHV